MKPFEQKSLEAKRQKDPPTEAGVENSKVNFPGMAATKAQAHTSKLLTASKHREPHHRKHGAFRSFAERLSGELNSSPAHGNGRRDINIKSTRTSTEPTCLLPQVEMG